MDNEVEPSDRRKRTRLRPGGREQAILAGAETFFAEKGFDATTRELADYLGIPQSLLYRYFPTKQDLIDRIYRDIFVDRWDPRWKSLILDRSLDLQDRLLKFYREYVAATMARQWIRLYIQAGLKGFDLNTQYNDLLHKEIFIPLCLEMRSAYCVTLLDNRDPTELEMQLITGLHGVAVYQGIREHIYGFESHSEPQYLEIWIESFVNYTVPATYRRLAAAAKVGQLVS